jgi:hypothetical protein
MIKWRCLHWNDAAEKRGVKGLKNRFRSSRGGELRDPSQGVDEHAGGAKTARWAEQDGPRLAGG